jgi:hypothetical protein
MLRLPAWLQNHILKPLAHKSHINQAVKAVNHLADSEGCLNRALIYII